MAKNASKKTRKAEAGAGTETGDTVHNDEVRAATGGAYDAAYEHAVARKIAEAEATCRKILTSDPTNAKALHLLGQIAVQSGNVPAAIGLFNRVLKAKPGFATAHYNLGVLVLGQGETEEAVTHFEKAIESKPDFAPAYNNLGFALYSQGKLEEAIASLQKAVTLEPNYAEAHNNLGNALKGQGKLEAAAASYQKAIALKPNSAEAHNNLGIALKEQGRLEEAIASYQKAIALKPNYAEAHNNLGNALTDLGRYDEAKECLNRALKIDPGHAPAMANLARLLLLLGDFGRAWALYTARQSVRRSPRALWQKPLPDELRGKRLFVLKDQGLGDEIFFLRFAPELKKRGAEIAYLAGAKIGSIVARLPFIDRVVREAEESEEVDFTLSVGDLPFILGMKSAADIPPPYPLPVQPERAARMQARLKRLGPPPHVGLTWRAGTADKPGSLFREISLDSLAAVVKRTSGTFLALQRKPEAGEIEALGDRIGRPVHDFTALNDALEDMLALLSLMDEYVTVDNTNVHLRAGTDKSSRILVPNPPDFRWMAEGEESPWFPGCGVYRQKADGDWEAALAALARDLEEAFRD